MREALSIAETYARERCTGMEAAGFSVALKKAMIRYGGKVPTMTGLAMMRTKGGTFSGKSSMEQLKYHWI